MPFSGISIKRINICKCYKYGKYAVTKINEWNLKERFESANRVWMYK